MSSRTAAPEESFSYKHLPVASEITADPFNDSTSLKVRQMLLYRAVSLAQFRTDLSSGCIRI